jgi:acetyl esterase/lipase
VQLKKSHSSVIRSFTPSFEDADPNPPDSSMREATKRALANSVFEFSLQVILATQKTLTGDPTDLNAFRIAIDGERPPSPPASHEFVISGVPIRHFYPPDSNPASLPLILFVHAGGWTHRFFGPTGSFAKELANAIPAEVVVPDYSVSPEARPGGAIEECEKIWNSVSPGRIAFIGGDSAGGNISAGLMFTLTETGNLPVGLFWIAPACELHDLSPPFSMKRFQRGYGMDEEEKRVYVDW